MKALFDSTENALKTKIRTAIAAYVLIAIVKKRLNLYYSLYEILRILDLNLFETTLISKMLGKQQNGTEMAKILLNKA